jgi:hypothetical protein
VVTEVAAPAPAPAPVPQKVYASPAPVAAPIVFQPLNQHEEDAEAHRPVRKRRHGGEQPAAESLQRVETSASPEPIAMADDEPQRRTKPRRRRGAPVESGPLQMVETTPGTESPSDSSASP